MATFQRNLTLGPSGQSQIELAKSLIQQGQQNSNVRTPLEAIGKTLQGIRGQQMMEDVQEQQKKRRDAYTRTMRNVATAGSEGTVTGPGGGGTGEVATARQRMIDYLSSNPDTAPTAAQMALSQALQPQQARTQTISGEQANRMFGTTLSPGAAVTVEVGPQGRRITDVQEGREQPQFEVKSQFGAVDTETGQRFTAVRTNRGLFRQSVDESGQMRMVPIDSRRVRPVKTLEQGTSGEVGLGTKATNDLQESVVNTDAQIQRFRQIKERFEDRFLTLPFKAEQSIKRGLEKMGADVGDEELQDYTKFQRDAIDSMNRYIKFVTGAQMSEAEAKRIRKGIPDPEKDSPTQFRSKLEGTIQALEAARRRATETLQRDDISQPWELGGLDQYQPEETNQTPTFSSQQEAMRAIEQGDVKVGDTVIVNGQEMEVQE